MFAGRYLAQSKKTGANEESKPVNEWANGNANGPRYCNSLYGNCMILKQIGSSQLPYLELPFQIHSGTTYLPAKSHELFETPIIPTKGLCHHLHYQRKHPHFLFFIRGNADVREARSSQQPYCLKDTS